MKDFLEPKLNVLLFRVEDVITTSGDLVDGDNGVVLPPDEFP